MTAPVKTVYAERHAARERTEVLLARLRDPVDQESDELLAGYLERWLDVQQLRLAPSTQRSYAGAVRRWIVPQLGDWPLAQLTSRGISQAYATLAQRGGRHGRSLSAGSVRYTHMILHKALEDAVREGSLMVNPATRAVVPRRDINGRLVRNPPRLWSRQQLADFLDWVSDHDLGPLLTVMASTGVRRGEALALAWPDVHSNEQWIDVNAALSDVNGRLVRGPLKSGKPRRIPIGDMPLQALRTQRRRRAVWRRDDPGHRRPPWDLVFTNRDGAPIEPMRLTTAFRRLVSRAPVPSIRLHDLRHTHAVLLLEAGVSMHVVGHRLGHQSVWTTLTTYAHVTDGSGREAANQFDGLMTNR